MKKTFLFIYHDFYLGGIQKVLINIIRKFKEKNIRIIWITRKVDTIDEGYKKDIFDGKIEIYQVDYGNFFWEKKLKLNFDKEEEIIAFSFSFFEYCNLERIKKRYPDIKFNTFFWVAHFCGKNLFFEEYFPKFFQSLIKKIVKNQYMKMEKNNNIFYNTKSHLLKMSEHYSYQVKNPAKKIYPKNIVLNRKNFDIKICEKKFNNKKFNILTVGRFDIPHKGYIIGLIKEFVVLKKDYPNLILNIIGYGDGEQKVLDEIEKVPESIKNDINLIGRVSFDKLKDYFKEANVFIGVAGALRDASEFGVLSIPVQHYTLECNGYGYSYQKKEFLTSTEQGENIKKYIKEVLNLTKEEYVELCKKTYKEFNPENCCNIGDYTLEMKNNSNSLQINNLFLFCLKMIVFLTVKFKKMGIKLWKE